MRCDGQVLPDLAETVVLHRLGMVRSDELPGLAARWLAVDLVDTDSVLMLAGHHPQDPSGLAQLLDDCVTEAGVTIPWDDTAVVNIAVDWVTTRWRKDGDTRAAVSTLASLDHIDHNFDLGYFVGGADTSNQGWETLDEDLKAQAKNEIDYFLHGEH